MGICDGRVVIVTGGGRGLGRAHSLAFAAEGAKVVVNDLGASLQGDATDESPGAEVVNEIRAGGGEAIVNGDDVSDWDGAGRLVAQAIAEFGALDTVVCNAGIVRDRMLVNMSVEEWDAVIRVHLRGVFCPVRHAIAYWRDESKAEHGRAGAHRHDHVRRRAARVDRADELRRGQGGDRRVHHQLGCRARSLRRHRQHHRAVRPQSDDRGRDARDDGASGIGLRRHGPRERVALRRVAGQRRTARSPGARSRWQAATCVS